MKREQDAMKRFLSILCAVALVCALAAGCKQGPRTIRTVRGEDGSRWEQVSRPGFGNKNNVSIVSMCQFQEEIYAVTTNNAEGFELWRTKRGGWDKVKIEGFTDGTFHDLMNNVWADLIVFQDKLYIVVSSGYQGSKLFKSVGFEMWRYDGETWEAVVSHTLGTQLEGTISSIESCSAADGSSTATFSLSGVTLTDNQTAGGILWITSGDGRGRVFDILGNTGSTLTIQQNEKAGEAEDTVCAAQEFLTDPPFPKYTVGAVAVGDSVKILKGVTANGFGEIWNKSIVDFEVYKDELYASVGFNYEKGARVWKSADGETWVPSSDYAMGMRHGYDPDGNPISFPCLVDGGETRNGQPVSSSLPKFGKLELGGEEILLIGGTGTSGCNGRGLRMFRLYDDGWKSIADYFVDNNTTGTNENGLGDDGSTEGAFQYANFQAWSWAMYDDVLFAGIARLTGGRIMYTADAEPADGSWYYAVGGDSAEPEGLGYNPNIVFNILNHNGILIAGSVEEESFTGSFVEEADRGADIWWATGPKNALTWTRVTKNAFRDDTIIQFEAPREFFDGDLYIVASSFGPSTPYKPDEPGDGGREGYRGAKIYRLASELK